MGSIAHPHSFAKQSKAAGKRVASVARAAKSAAEKLTKDNARLARAKGIAPALLVATKYLRNPIVMNTAIVAGVGALALYFLKRR